MTLLDWIYIGWCLSVATVTFCLGFTIGKGRGEKARIEGYDRLSYQEGYTAARAQFEREKHILEGEAQRIEVGRYEF